MQYWRPNITSIVVALGSALVVASTLTACPDCSDGTPPIPETAEGRLDTYADALPARTESALVVADIPALTRGSTALRDRFGEFIPGTNIAVRRLKMATGVDLFSRQGWSEVGIEDTGGATLAVVDGHPILLAHVSDRQAFERRLKQLIERHYSITGSVRIETDGDVRMKVLRRSGAQVAWTYRDRMAAVVFPTLESAPDAGPTVTNTLRDLPDADGETLTDVDGFRTLRDDAAEGPNFAYARPQSISRYLVGDGGWRAVAVGTAVNWLIEPLTGVGAGLGNLTDRLTGSIWVGTRSPLTEALAEVTAVEPAPIGGDLTGPGTLAAARAAVDLEAAWTHILDVLPDATSRSIRRRLKRYRDRTDLDPIADLAAPATGRLFVALRDVDRNFSLPAFVSDPLNNLGSIDAVAGLEFPSAEAASEALSKLRDATSEPQLFGLPLQLRQSGALLLSMTESVDPASLEEPSPDGDAPDLHRAFTDGDDFAALYINGLALADRFDNRLPPGNPAARLLDRFRGGLVTLSHRKTGVILEGEVDVD